MQASISGGDDSTKPAFQVQSGLRVTFKRACMPAEAALMTSAVNAASGESSSGLDTCTCTRQERLSPSHIARAVRDCSEKTIKSRHACRGRSSFSGSVPLTRSHRPGPLMTTPQRCSVA